MPHADPQPDRSGKRRPFATWVKKLTNFKSSGDGTRQSHSKLRMHGKRRAGKKNNPYPQSGHPARPGRPYDSSASTGSETSLERPSARLSLEGGNPPTAGARSVALTVETDHEASRSINAPSHGASSVTGTARTIGGAQESRQEGSTFSSPAPSVRSLTTTLTTIQSLANGNGAPNPNAQHGGSHHSSANVSQSITFNQPFPTTPASALPPHLAPQGQQGPPGGSPTTYSAATANNLLTDNASILTLASSSKRRRRRSFDTDASVRAMAPSSLWGGSRESLPLSVLSANVEGAPMQRVSAAGERASLYSAAASVGGVERGSAYARQSAAGDGASVRSGLLGHGRAESVSGSAGLASPLVSPLEVPGVDELEEGQAAAAEKREAVEKE